MSKPFIGFVKNNNGLILLDISNNVYIRGLESYEKYLEKPYEQHEWNTGRKRCTWHAICLRCNIQAAYAIECILSASRNNYNNSKKSMADFIDTWTECYSSEDLILKEIIE
jgi:hypothetical protein